MRFVHRDAGIEREWEARLGRPDAVVADLAAALGAPGSGLVIDGRPAPPGAPLAGSGLVAGSEVGLPSVEDFGFGAERSDTDATATIDPGAVLRIVGGLDAGLSVRLEPGRMRLGRGEEAEIRVNSRDVSRLHCEIDVTEDGRVTVTDLGSRNGTDVNGVRLTGSAQVGPNDLVCAAGRVPFRVLPVPSISPTAFVNPAREAGPGGTLPFNRAPRVAMPPDRPPIRLPEPPNRSQGVPMRISTIVFPLLLAGVMVVLLKNPAYAMIALFSPMIMIGSQVEDRLRGRNGSRRGKRAYAADLTEACDLLAVRRAEQQARLLADFPDVAEYFHRATAPGLRLWERRRGAADFLQVSAGYADRRWEPPVERPRRNDLELDERLTAALAAASGLKQVPVPVNLAAGGVLGMEGDRVAALAAARALLSQAATGSGPADVAIAVFADEDRIADWEWTKWLPHGTDPRDGTGRLVAIGSERSEALARTLLTDFGATSTPSPRDTDASGPGSPVLLVIVDGATLLEGRPCYLRDLLGGRVGSVSGIVLTRRLPALCTEVLSVAGDGSGRLRRVATGEQVDEILVAGMTKRRANGLARALARFEDPELKSEGSGLPDRVGLLPLLELPGQLDIAVGARWRTTLETLRVRAVLGVTERELFEIDLDDDGPHGLIAGTTGSGKSELLRTLIISLAVGTDPEHLTFALVDYKGGGALDECAQLPHVVGLVTDLDEQLGERALRCLEAELRYREHALRGVGLSHVRDYQRLRDTQRPDLEPMPRLVVVIDEFATLVKALPAFVDSLVSIAQRGRSLGMHLIMATQRPSGSVSDAIKNNVKLRLALRLESATDSQDVIDSPAAAGIGSRQWGRGFYRVSANEVLPVQTALSTGVTAPTAVSSGVTVVPFRLAPDDHTMLAASDTDVTGDAPTDLALLVEAARWASAKAGIGAPRRPWPDPLPDSIPLFELGFAVRGVQTDATDLPAYALADDPDRQAQYPVGWDPAAGNMLIYGVVGSGTSTALNALALSVAVSLPPDSQHIYALDMGSGDLAPLAGLPHTGAYIGPTERARQIRLIRMLRAELNARKEGGAGAGRRGHAARPARWLVLIDNVGALRAELEKDYGGLSVLDDLERVFADGPAVGLHIAATADRAGAVPSAWAALCRQKLLLRLADPGDYAPFDIPRSAVPAALPGRALVVASRQIVQIGYPGADPGSAVMAVAHRWGEARRTAFPVRLLPERIDAGQLQASGAVAHTGLEPWSVPVGFADSNLAPVALKLYEHENALITGPPRSGRSSALVSIAAIVLAGPEPPNVVAFAPRRSPLRDLPEPVVVCTDYAQLDSVLAPFEGRTLLLVDDADTIPDGLGVIDRFIAKAGPGRHLIAAGRNDGVRRQFGLWTQRVREGRCGVLLVPDHELDGDLLGSPLPRQHRMAPLPGRGYLVSDGRMEGVQLVLADMSAVSHAEGRS
ncbi:FtsK/SpoIIIE domain-containing protein [Actinospica sp.]|uniref:FtsK/SpoIIIE domain-containing protein n=1 Tax=Actinospica sp. TaxID=1872142 RepID=UPI002CFC347B|nr:FtsK/SpoIIIE domain-containing protein [Actinospica sp.]HWG24202.1 FtsK/SpoIIIE domain-containing protein [Actinospica sp.]